MPTRRQILAGAALALGGVLAGVGATAVHWWDQDPAEPYRHLSADEVAFLDAFAEAIFPAGGDPPLGGRGARVGRYLDTVVLAGLHPTQRNLLRLAMHALETLPLATHGSAFSALPRETATRVIAAWVDHEQAELRGVAQSLYIFVGMAWFAHPEVAPSVTASFSCGFGE